MTAVLQQFSGVDVTCMCVRLLCVKMALICTNGVRVRVRDRIKVRNRVRVRVRINVSVSSLYR